MKNKLLLCYGYLIILLVIPACTVSTGVEQTLEPPGETPSPTISATPELVTVQPSPVPATPTANMPEPTTPPVYAPPTGFKEYQDAVTGITLFIPESWVVSFVDPGQYAILQSYPEDKYIGGEGLQPGDTKCDLNFPLNTGAAELLQQWKSDPNATIISEQDIVLESGNSGSRLEIDNRGHSLSLITEIDNQAVTLVCFGEFAPFDDIAMTLHAK